jgi:hypothetical protein
MAKTEAKAESYNPGPLVPERRWDYFNLAMGVVAITGVFCWLQFATPSICCGDYDGYYHIKWSQMLWTGLRHFNFPPTFEWLPLTTLGPTQYADQHFLFHVLLIPFTWFGELRLGAKVAAVLFGSAAVFSLYWLTLRYRIRYPLLWLMALLGCGWAFYVRLNMTKAQSISIVFIVAGIILLFERKYVWLAPAAFLYVWTYNLFVLLGVLALIWTAVVWWSERKVEWKPLLWTAIGMLAGFVVNPFFPHDVHLFIHHLVAKSGKMSISSGVGFEWYPLASLDFLQGSFIACAAMAVGYIAFGYALGFNRNERVRLQRPLLLMLFSTFLLLITVRSARFMEYWPPLAVVFAAFAMQSAWNAAESDSDNSDAKVEESDSGSEGEEAYEGMEEEASAARLAKWQVSVIGVLLAAGMVYSLRLAHAKISDITLDPDHYRAGAEWMRMNIPAGALIYDLFWWDFPKLFYYDTEHRYVSGLDPLYLAGLHPELQSLSDRLELGTEPDPAAAIHSLFAGAYVSGVRYVFVGDDPKPPPAGWFQYMQSGSKITQVYADRQCVILQLVENPGNAGSTNMAPEVPSAPPKPNSQWDDPRRRKAAAEGVHLRFGRDIYGTVDEKYEGGPALVVHNKKATEEWAHKLFTEDMGSPTNELMWQIGFRNYLVTNESEAWQMDVEEDPKYRSLFKGPPPSLKP